MRERRDSRLTLSILLLICQKVDYVPSAKHPRMLLWLSRKPKTTKTKMINEEKTKFPRNKASLISLISTYDMIAYLNVMMSSKNMIVITTMFSLTKRRQSLQDQMNYLQF